MFCGVRGLREDDDRPAHVMSKSLYEACHNNFSASLVYIKLVIVESKVIGPTMLILAYQ